MFVCGMSCQFLVFCGRTSGGWGIRGGGATLCDMERLPNLPQHGFSESLRLCQCWGRLLLPCACFSPPRSVLVFGLPACQPAIPTSALTGRRSRRGKMKTVSESDQPNVSLDTHDSVVCTSKTSLSMGSTLEETQAYVENVSRPRLTMQCSREGIQMCAPGKDFRPEGKKGNGSGSKWRANSPIVLSLSLKSLTLCIIRFLSQHEKSRRPLGVAR